MASINKRGTSWQVRYREVPNGPQKSRTFARQADAKRFVTELEHQLDTGTYVSQDLRKVTVGEWWAKWSRTQAWSPATRERHAITWRLHIEPTIGGRRLSDVRRSDLQALLVESGLAPSTKKLVRSLLASMFGAAVSDRLLHASPATGLQIGKDTAEGPRPLTTDEQRTLLEACTPWERTWVLLGLSTGVRISEGLAVRTETIDLEARCLKVADQAVAPQRGPAALGPVKNRKPRQVPLAADLAASLRWHAGKFGTGEHGALFPGTDGKLMRRQVAGHRFAAIVKRAGLDPSISWHNLRDTAATTMLRDGMNPASVAKIIGNTVPVLLTRYAGVLPDDFELARQSLDRLAARAVGS